MVKKNAKRRVYVELTAYWCNQDAVSTIKVSRRRWKKIQEGADYTRSARGWYEGSRFFVEWNFGGGEFKIDGDDGAECVVDCPISELIVQMSPHKKSE